MWEVISHCDFDLHLSYDYWWWAPFHVSVGHAFFGKMFIQFICPLKKLDCLFFFFLSQLPLPYSLPTIYSSLFPLLQLNIILQFIYYLFVSHWNGIATNRIFVCFVYCYLSPAWHIISVPQYVFNEWINEHILSTYYALNII